MMTPREEQLWQVYHETRSTADRNALVLNYLPVARRVATQYCLRCRGAIPFGDLYSDCVMGLIFAVHTYEFGHGAMFITFAKQKIRYFLLDSVRLRDIPRQRRFRSIQIFQAEAELFHELGRPATEQELCQKLRLTESAWRTWRNSRNIAPPRHLGLDDNLPHVASHDESIENLGTAIDIEKWLSDCTDKERAAMLLPAYLGWSIGETARRLRLSPSGITYVRRLAANKARMRAAGGER